MKTTPRIRGQIADITGQGARIRLDDGRDGFVSTTDYFWSEWIVNGRIGEGDSLYFDVLGMLPDGRVSLGFEPVGEKSSRLVGVDQQWVTSLEEVRGECPDEVYGIERHPSFNETNDLGFVGWMRVAHLLEESPAESADELNGDSTCGRVDEACQPNHELLSLAKKLFENFRQNTQLELKLEILEWGGCDRIHTLPLAGTEGWIDQDGRCCIFTVHGMQAITAAGKKFVDRSECREWAQYG